MGIYKCPHCRENFAAHDYDDEFMHQCDSLSKAINQEDFVNLGFNTAQPALTATDASGQNNSAGQAGLRGNELRYNGGFWFGNIKGVAYTPRANLATISDQRQHYEFIQGLPNNILR